MKNFVKSLGTVCAALLVSAAAEAHLVSFGWTDNGNGTVTLWGEHWHGNLTAPDTANGGITVSDQSGTLPSFTAQWVGVLNDTDRDVMVGNGTLTGYADAGNGFAKNNDWMFTEALVLGNGTWNFYTGPNCCIDTMGNPVTVVLDGITSVEEGTGPGAVAMPEPGGLAIFGLGLAGLGFAARRKTRAV